MNFWKIILVVAIILLTGFLFTKFIIFFGLVGIVAFGLLFFCMTVLAMIYKKEVGKAA